MIAQCEEHLYIEIVYCGFESGDLGLSNDMNKIVICLSI